jgi:glucokinase
MPIILAGDTGGTKTNLGIYSLDGGSLRELRSRSFRTLDFTRLEEIVEAFLEGERIDSACFGLAGPVIDGQCEVTNIQWTIVAADVSARLGIANVHLLNDLMATAHGIGQLRPDEFYILQEGRPEPERNQALIAAGTGLGECTLFWNGAGYVPAPSEAGHADWAPHDEIHIDLWRYLRAELSEVGVERVVSGPGLVNCYRFLLDLQNRDLQREDLCGAGEPNVLADAPSDGEEPAAVIVRHAEAGTSRLCQQALDMFLCAYGAEAGNMALRALAVGGVYLGGGIAPKLLAHLAGGSFLRAFREKYLLGPMMKDIPIKIILNERTALLGAAHYAAERL